MFVRDAALQYGWKAVVLTTTASAAIALVAIFVLWRRQPGQSRASATQGEAHGIDQGASPPAVGSWRTTRNLLFGILIIGWFGFCAAGSTILTFGAAYLAEASSFSEADKVMGLLMIGVLPGSPLLGRLADYLGDRSKVLMGSALFGVLIHLAFTYRIGPPWIVVLLMGFLYAGGVPSATYSLVAEMFPGQRLATAFGVLLTFSNTGSLAGPFIAGYLRDHSDNHFLGMQFMCAMTVLILLAAIAFYLVKRRMRAAWPAP